jgi:pimeloyl-ACP methyl ester carboxylesterase
MSERVILTAMTAVILLIAGGRADANGCPTGLYRSPDGRHQAAMIQPADGPSRYTFADGRRGILGSAGALACTGGEIRDSEGAWTRAPLTFTAVNFMSHGTTLSGQLIEPPSRAKHPLVVLVHGSEKASPLQSYYPYILASYGLAVFAYDKRGTGASEGEYTQNFELLADDAAAALREARRLDAGRFSRAGFFGGSQGGWVAPLAATRSPADFVAVGFGLIATPLEEDREEVADELREKGYSPQVIAAGVAIAEAAGRLVSSHFTTGFDKFDRVKRRFADAPWLKDVRGEYTGAMLAETDADLRRVGRALYDNLEIIWNYDAMATMRRVKAPQLWVIAERDREAPPEETLARLERLRRAGAKLAIYSFPNTDHGIIEFTEAPDGTRTYTRFADGYFRLLADWIKGAVAGPYGRARAR